MAFDPQPYASNLLLAATLTADLEKLAPHLEWVEHSVRDQIGKPGEPEEFVYFPVSGIFSIITLFNHDNQVEAGLIGKEGMFGTWVALLAGSSPFLLVCQAGRAILAPAGQRTHHSLRAMPDLQAVLLHFTHIFTVQLAGTILANSSYTIEERLARWILMSQDRLDSCSFAMTHDYMALMLAVRRPGVTEAIHMLEAKRLVHATRGHMQILNRDGLLDLAGESYGQSEREHHRLIIPAARP